MNGPLTSLRYQAMSCLRYHWKCIMSEQANSLFGFHHETLPVAFSNSSRYAKYKEVSILPSTFFSHKLLWQTFPRVGFTTCLDYKWISKYPVSILCKGRRTTSKSAWLIQYEKEAMSWISMYVVAEIHVNLHQSNL